MTGNHVQFYLELVPEYSSIINFSSFVEQGSENNSDNPSQIVNEIHLSHAIHEAMRVVRHHADGDTKCIYVISRPKRGVFTSADPNWD